MDLVAECLGLRHWALSIFTGTIRRPELISACPPASSRAWALFLATEACAHALSTCLAADVALLPAHARCALEHATRLEVQRTMAARGQLAALDVLAAESGVSPTVLKGGVHIADRGEAFDLADIDLLLTTAALELFHGVVLERGGYVVAPSIEQLSMDGGITLELHDHLAVGPAKPIRLTGAARPIPGFRALHQLAPADHVIYCIQHSTTKHPFRRGHLRDVLMIADAMNDCSPYDLALVEELLAASEHGVTYSETLRLANAIRPGTAPGVPVRDVFRRIAACKYAAGQWIPDTSPLMAALTYDRVAQFITPPREWGAQIREYLVTDFPASRARIPFAARLSRRLTRPLELAVRTPVRLVALLSAFMIAMALRGIHAYRWRQVAVSPLPEGGGFREGR